jgi:hypothetical protein
VSCFVGPRQICCCEQVWTSVPVRSPNFYSTSLIYYYDDISITQLKTLPDCVQTWIIIPTFESRISEGDVQEQCNVDNEKSITLLGLRCMGCNYTWSGTVEFLRFGAGNREALGLSFWARRQDLLSIWHEAHFKGPFPGREGFGVHWYW